MQIRSLKKSEKFVFNKVAGLQFATLLKKRSSQEFKNFFDCSRRLPILKNNSQWLHLTIFSHLQWLLTLFYFRLQHTACHVIKKTCSKTILDYFFKRRNSHLIKTVNQNHTGDRMSLNFKISIKERVLMEWVTLISQIKWIYKKEINMLHSHILSSTTHARI